MPESTYQPDDEPRRGYARLRLGISAQLQTLRGPQRVRLMDLSQGGAHLVLSRAEPLKQAFLSWLGFEVFGDIVWQDGPEVGMRFDRPLSVGQLVETRRCAPSVVRDEQQDAEVAARTWAVGDGSR
jgi:hypothetical protein